MNRNTVKTIAILIPILLVAVLVSLLFRSKQADITSSIQVPAIGQGAVYQSSSILYASDGVFMAYNTRSHINQSISTASSLGLGTIDSLSVSPNSQYALFHDNAVDPSGSLYTQLIQRGLDPSQDYWWVFDITNQTFTPLPAGTLLAKITNSQVYGLTNDDSGEHITKLNVPNLDVQSTLTITRSVTFDVSATGIVLQTAANKLVITSTGTVSRVLGSNLTLVGLSTDGKYAVAIQGASSGGNLVRIDLQSGNQKTITKSIIGTPVMNGDVALYTINNPSTTNATSVSLYRYNVVTDKAIAVNASSATGLSFDGLQPVLAVSNTTALVNSKASNYLITLTP